MSSKLFIGCVLLAQVTLFGECLQGNGRGYLIGLLAAQRRMQLAALSRAKPGCCCPV